MTKNNIAAQQTAADRHSVKSSLSILIGASVWGIAWFPYRMLAGWGLGGMSAAALVGCAAVVAAGALSGLVHRSRRAPEAVADGAEAIA